MNYGRISYSSVICRDFNVFIVFIFRTYEDALAFPNKIIHLSLCSFIRLPRPERLFVL